MRTLKLIPRSLVFTAWAALSLLAACDVHELPIDNDSTIDVALLVTRDEPFTLYKTVEYTVTKAEAADYVPHYVVRIHHYVDEMQYSVEPDLAFTWTGEPGEQVATVPVESLPSRKYRVFIWCDLVRAGSEKSAYTASGDVWTLSVSKNTYTTAPEVRDAFQAAVDMDLSDVRSGRQSYRQEVTLTRPHSKVTFIANDKEEYLERGETLDDLSAFKTVINYTTGIPLGFSVYSGKVSSVTEGLSYTAKPFLYSNGEPGLGYDYFFTPEGEGTVGITMSFYKGTELLSTFTGDVPVRRGCETIIRGNFLTGGTSPLPPEPPGPGPDEPVDGSGGISINPGFDGDIDTEF